MWAVVCAIAIVDALTKWLAVQWLAGFPFGHPVLPVFNLTLVYNSGISFGMLRAKDPAQVWLLSSATLVAVAGLAWMASKSETSLERAGYGLVLGGAIGNVIDRLHDGVVTDFLDFHMGGWRYPTFNFADVAITFGVGTLFFSLLKPNSAPHDDMRST